VNVACPDCDLLHASGPLRAGERACCTRCGAALSIRGPRTLEKSLATAAAAAITFWIANTEPLMRLSALGIANHTTIARSAAALWVEGSPAAATVVAFCAIVAPAACVHLTLAALFASRRRRAPHWVGTPLRWANAMWGWALPEVMLLGILVAYVKVSEVADASPGMGLYAAGALAILMASLRASLDLPALWSRVEGVR
jgi:paraquat-inducible protein A